jgi:hypothetical protein
MNELFQEFIIVISTQARDISRYSLLLLIYHTCPYLRMPRNSHLALLLTSLSLAQLVGRISDGHPTGDVHTAAMIESKMKLRRRCAELMNTEKHLTASRDAGRRRAVKGYAGSKKDDARMVAQPTSLRSNGLLELQLTEGITSVHFELRDRCQRTVQQAASR